jgi:predicted ATPase
MTAHSYLAWAMWLLGYPDQAAKHNRESLKLAREVDHTLSRGHGLFFGAVHAHLCQNWDAFNELANELVFFGKERNLTFWLSAGRVLSGLTLTKNSKEAGIEEMRGGIEALVAARNKLNLTILHRLLAEAYACLFHYEEAFVAIQAALDLIEGTRERFFEPELHRFQGELTLQQGGCDAETKAEACFQRSLDLARRQSAKSWEVRACTSLSRLWARRGKRSEAFELLAPVCDWFTEGLGTGDVKEARALVEELR